jgi:hypothetical protein
MKCSGETKFSEIGISVYMPLFTNKTDYANMISSLIQRVLKFNKGG